MDKNLHLFGLGNALVDVQLQVDEDAFSHLNLRKGGMALVDAAQQKEILDRFLHLEAFKCSGGSAANTVIAFAQFGGKAAYGTRLGKDDNGSFYASEFQNLGIELHADLMENEHTGTCLVLITPDAERTLNTSLAVNTSFTKEHVSEDAIRRAEWMYIEGYKFSEESGAEAIDHAMYYAKKYDTKIAVTFSDAFIVQYFSEGLRKAVASADLIFCNEVEAQAFTGTGNSEEAFRALREAAPNVALTLGEKGSKVHVQGRSWDIPSVPVTPVDTTGAGDIYAAGFLYGITHNHTPEQAGILGATAAAKVISQLGARLHDREFAALRHQALG